MIGHSHYHPGNPGQYTPPPDPPRRRQMPRWGRLVVACSALLILAIGIGTALTIDRAARAGDSGPVTSTYDPGLYTPNVHKPGPPMCRPVR